MKKIILPVVILLLLLSSCLTENETTFSVKGGSREVEMLFTGSFDTGTGISFSDTDIAQLDLVVCKEGRFQYLRPGYAKADRFHATLKTDENVDIYFFANVRSALEELNPEQGMPWEDIQRELTLTQTLTVLDGQKAVLPMWGRLKGVTISEHTVNNLGEITLLRAVSLTNVYFELDGEDKGLKFTPEVAYLYFAADKGLVAPSEENLKLSTKGTPEGVYAPESPWDMKTNVRLKALPEANSFVDCFYMFDNPTEETNQADGMRRTRLVVGGKLEDSEEYTYYPLDFFETGKEELLSVTRNQKYNLTITSVNGEGWPDPDVAAEKQPVNINYNIIPWNEKDHGDIAIDGPDYLSVSRKSITLYRKSGSETFIRLSGTYKKEDFTLSFLNSLNGNVQNITSGIRNDRFQAQISGTGTDLSITVKALKDYSAQNPAFNLEQLQITAGRIRFTVDIEQITSRGWDDGGEEEIEF